MIMKKKFLTLIVGIMMVIGAMAPSSAVLALNEAGTGGGNNSSSNSSNRSAGDCSGGVTVFGLDPWWKALDRNGCEILQSNFEGDKLTGTVIKIVAVVVKDLMFVAGFLAVGFVMYGGFLMVTSAGNPGAVEKAKKTISGSIIGLVIAILAYAIVTTVLGVVVNGDMG